MRSLVQIVSNVKSNSLDQGVRRSDSPLASEEVKMTDYVKITLQSINISCMCLDHRLFFPSHQRFALHHINPQSPLTNTLHGHDLDFALVWLWLSSNSPTLFFVNYLTSELSFSVAMSMYSFFSILREWNHLTPLSMQLQISHLCSYSVLNATNPRSCCQAICI